LSLSLSVKPEEIVNSLRSLPETKQKVLKGRRGKIINKIFFVLQKLQQTEKVHGPNP